MRATGLLALLLVTSGFTGCIGAFDDGPDEQVEQTSSTSLDEIEDLLTVREDGVPKVHVPVDVVVLGFEDGVADRLDEKLEPNPVEQTASSVHRAFPPDPSDPKPPLSFSAEGPPMVPVAHYRVHDAPASLEEAFFDHVGGAAIDEADGIYDGNEAEAFLAERLPEHGIEVDEDRPLLVLAHDDGRLAEDHGYRYTYPNGYLEPVRVFGEREPVLFMDLSARPDPYDHSDPGPLGGVLLPDDAPDSYDYPVPPSGEEAVEPMAEATVAATEYRLLQASTYPITTKPCHAITLVLAVRATSVSHPLPTHDDARDLVDVEGLESSFENLTGRDNVHVDLDVRMLPHEDPFLDAASRGAIFTNDPVRWWIDENWEDYWIEREGCEPYVSFLVLGDVADPISAGIGAYDTEKSHRISFSVVDGRSLLTETYRGPGQGTVHDRNESIDEYDVPNLFFAHEVGHTIGQRHPHDVWEAGGEEERMATSDQARNDRTFSSVWSTMSYQTDDRITDFGAVDRANHQRNRAGWLVQAAVEEGLQDTPAFQRAVEHLEAYRWLEAGELLEDALATSASASTASGR